MPNKISKNEYLSTVITASLFLFFLSHPPIILSLSYSLNTTALHGLWHRAAVMALLRLQAKSLVEELNLSSVERIVFSECEREAQKVVEMAKCVAKLLKKRERVRKKQKDERRTKWAEETEDEEKWGMGERGEEPNTESIVERLVTIWKGTFGGGAATTAPNTKKLHFRLADKDEETYSFNTVFGQRRRRAAPGARFAHMDNLHQLQRFWEMRQFCEDSLAGMAQRNAEFLRSQLPFRVKLRVDKLLGEKFTSANELQLMDDISKQLTNFLRNVARRKRGPVWRRLSIISPRLLSMASPLSREGSQPNSDQLINTLLLSPHLFSLFPNDGLFALPDLFNNEKIFGKKNWMNAILELSGAGKAIRKALDRTESERRRLEEQVFPTVLEMEHRDRQWRDLLDEEQKQRMKKHGFAFLTKEQAKLVYGKEKVIDAEFLASNPRQRQHRIEKAILALANLDKQITDGTNKLERKRRQIVMKSRQSDNKMINRKDPIDRRIGVNEDAEKERAEPSEWVEEHLKVLAPYAFANSVADGVALEATILSPSAFVSELISPVALSTEILSPRAFIAAILSPEALFARVLSPSAFFSDVLSPSALTPFILSPEAMFTEILSPRALEPRILSPEIGMVKVLSPEFLSPRVISPEQFAILVLSPAILSPDFLSGQKMVVEIISPHILSGSNEIEEQKGEHHPQEHEEGHQHGVGSTLDHQHGVGSATTDHQHGALDHQHGVGSTTDRQQENGKHNMML